MLLAFIFLCLMIGLSNFGASGCTLLPTSLPVAAHYTSQQHIRSYKDAGLSNRRQGRRWRRRPTNRRQTTGKRSLHLFALSVYLLCFPPAINTSFLDRIPLYTAPSRHPLRQHSRHQRRAQPARRAHRGPKVLITPTRNLQHLWLQVALCTSPTMPQCNTNERRARMGSPLPRHRRAA